MNEQTANDILRAVVIAVVAPIVTVAALVGLTGSAGATEPSDGPYGASAGAVCGTDAQCAAYSREVLHEAPSGYAAEETPHGLFVGANGELIAIPNSARLETTPVLCWEGEFTDLSGTMCVPDESPFGGYVVDWADNSPIYSDGWWLYVNDATGDIRWSLHNA